MLRVVSTDGERLTAKRVLLCLLADAEAVSSRELIVAADSGQTPGRCCRQADSSLLSAQTCGPLSRCNEIICYTGSSPEPYALLPTGQRSTVPLWSEHECFETQTSWGKKGCKRNFVNNGLVCILAAQLSTTMPLVGWLVCLVGGVLIRTIRLVSHDIRSLAPWRIKPTDLGGPVEATPEGWHVCV